MNTTGGTQPPGIIIHHFVAVVVSKRMINSMVVRILVDPAANVGRHHHRGTQGYAG